MAFGAEERVAALEQRLDGPGIKHITPMHLPIRRWSFIRRIRFSANASRC
jgi:hypothetical protein